MSAGARYRLRFGWSAIVLLASALDPANLGDLGTSDRPLDDVATAVVVTRHQSFEVASASSAKSIVTIETTVLEPGGREHGVLSVYHDKYRRIKSLRGRVTDVRGKVVRKLKNEYIEDVAAGSSESLYQEGRYRTARLYHSEYPYTVSYEYEIEHRGLINWPTWYPGEESVPTLSTRFELTAPYRIPVRFVTRGIDIEPLEVNSNGRTSYVWELSSLPVFRAEPWGPSWSQQRPYVLTAPSQFEIDDRPGDMTTWSGFAGWYRELMSDRAQISEAMSETISDLTRDIEDPVERARVVYRYVQSRTRYVSVQLGIGRWQPEKAEIVHTRRYGDCKALTNYTMALLKAAGVTAYPALIRTGHLEPSIIADFPCNQYNHVILYIPTDSDAIWLECTSQTKPFGHIGAANEDRYALVVRPEGGELVRTPASGAISNTRKRIVSLELKESLDGSAEISLTYTGNRADVARESLGGAGASWRDNLRDMIDAPSFEVASAERVVDGVQRDSVVVRMLVELRRLATRGRSRIFFRPNPLDRWTAVPPKMENRSQPVTFGQRFRDVDSVAIRIPPYYSVETLPEIVDVATSFGSYRSHTVVLDSTHLLFTRELRIESPEVPADEYSDVIDFFAEVARADGQQVVLRRSR